MNERMKKRNQVIQSKSPRTKLTGQRSLHGRHWSCGRGRLRGGASLKGGNHFCTRVITVDTYAYQTCDYSTFVISNLS